MTDGQPPDDARIPLLSGGALVQSATGGQLRFDPLLSSVGPANINLVKSSAIQRFTLDESASLLDRVGLRASETSSVVYVSQNISFFEGTEKDKTWTSIVPRTKSLEERLFDALASVKVLTSKIAMHLDRKWRDRLFAQLDRMHSPGAFLDPNAATQIPASQCSNSGLADRGCAHALK